MEDEAWVSIVKIIRDRRIKKICSRLRGGEFERRLVSKCRALDDVELCEDEHEADAVFVDRKCGMSPGKTEFEVLRFTQPQFENRDLISVVYDIETVNRRRGVKIDDQIVSLVMTVCIVDRPIDATYLCVADPRVTSWEKLDKPPVLNRFSKKYAQLITDQYKDPTTGNAINVIHCKEGEKQLVLSFIKMLNLIKPHNLVTFNGETIDLPYQIRAAFRYGIDMAEELSLVSPKWCSHAGLNQIRAARKKFSRAGFINKCVLDLSHDAFNAFVHTDLCKYNSGSLNEVCKTKLGLEKVDLPYTEIPHMVDTRHEKLFIYNIQDTELTTRLFAKDYFVSIRYFFVLKKINYTYWDTSASLHRSAPAYQANYSTNERFGFVQPPVLKPSRLHAKNVFEELVDYFIRHRQRIDIKDLQYEKCKQLLIDYHNGALETRNDVKKLPNGGSGALHVLEAQFTANKGLSSLYTTVGLLVYLSHLSNGPFEKGQKKCFNDLFKKFVKMFRFNGKTPEKNQKLLQDEYDKFCNLMYYMTTVRRFLSPFDNAKLLCTEYADYYKTCTTVHALKLFYDRVMTDGETITEEVFRAVQKCQALYRARKFDPGVPEAIVSCIKSKTAQMAVKMLSYDGAYIADPIKGINCDYPVVVVDIASQYPSCIQALNMSPQTELSLDYILRHDLKPDVDFYPINRKRCDDMIDYTQYLELGMDEYVRNMYIFFLTELPDRSRMACPIVLYTKQINDRLRIKGFIKRAKTDEERRVLTEMSDAFKVGINSFYGVLGLMSGQPKYMPCVTAKGRRTIHSIRHTLKRLYGNDLLIRYGDTDSVVLFTD